MPSLWYIDDILQIYKLIKALQRGKINLILKLWSHYVTIWNPLCLNCDV